MLAFEIGMALRDGRKVVPVAGTRIGLLDGVASSPGLAIGTNTAKFKIGTAFAYRILNVRYTKAITDALVFSAADTINVGTAVGIKYGIWAIQINAAGAVSTKSPAADQTYTSAALALAALPLPDAGKQRIAHIIIGAKTGAAWTANTDDMVAASDCDSVVFANETAEWEPENYQSNWGVRLIDITADAANTGIIVLGASTVVAAAATRRGMPLAKDDSRQLWLADPAAVFLDATVSGEGVSYAFLLA